MTKEEVYVTMSLYHEDYREIITRAVCSRGKKQTKTSHLLSPTYEPSTILGCWIINHAYKAKRKNKSTVVMKGTYDIHVWYAYDQNMKTAIATENVSYEVDVPMKKEDEHCLESDCDDILAKVIKQPNCLQCNIVKDSRKIKVDVEKEFAVQVIGETKVYVKVESVHEKEKPHRKTEGKGNYRENNRFSGSSPFSN